MQVGVFLVLDVMGGSVVGFDRWSVQNEVRVLTEVMVVFLGMDRWVDAGPARGGSFHFRDCRGGMPAFLPKI